MGAELVVPGVRYASKNSAQCPHASGGGAVVAGLTGTAAGTVDCTALAGRIVEISTLVEADGTDGGIYRFCWLTATEAAGSPAFQTATAVATEVPAAGAKVPSKVGGGVVVPQMVDHRRPILLYQAYAAPASAESVIVAVAQPDVIV